MSAVDEKPRPYKVSITGWVHDRLLELADVAKARGDNAEFSTALREFLDRLRVYPQFGDPLSDLIRQEGHIRLGIVPPLTMRYAVLEQDRRVFLAAPPVLMPRVKSRGNS